MIASFSPYRGASSSSCSRNLLPPMGAVSPLEVDRLVDGVIDLAGIMVLVVSAGTVAVL